MEDGYWIYAVLFVVGIIFAIIGWLKPNSLFGDISLKIFGFLALIFAIIVIGAFL